MIKNEPQERTNDEHICLKSFRKRIICSARYYTKEMQELFADPDRFYTNTALSYLKNDKNTQVVLFSIHNHKFIIKKYCSRNILYLLKKLFSRKRVYKSMHNGLLLANLGFNTPKPIATIEKRFGILGFESYLITEYIDGTNGFKYFADKGVSLEHKTITIETIANIAHKLASNMITHGDLQFGNMLVCGNKVFMIDLDRMHLHKRKNWLYKNKRMRDIRILLEHPKDDQQLRELMYKALFCF